MPSKLDKVNLPRKFDRRVKLTEEEREEIKKIYVLGGIGYQKLANEFGVSKRTVYWIINPEKQKENYALRVANGGSAQYYDRVAHRKSMKELRHYKKALDDVGLLQDEEEL